LRRSSPRKSSALCAIGILGPPPRARHHHSAPAPPPSAAGACVEEGAQRHQRTIARPVLVTNKQNQSRHGTGKVPLYLRSTDIQQEKRRRVLAHSAEVLSAEGTICRHPTNHNLFNEFFQRKAINISEIAPRDIPCSLGCNRGAQHTHVSRRLAAQASTTKVFAGIVQALSSCKRDASVVYALPPFRATPRPLAVLYAIGTSGKNPSRRFTQLSHPTILVGGSTVLPARIIQNPVMFVDYGCSQVCAINGIAGSLLASFWKRVVSGHVPIAL